MIIDVNTAVGRWPFQKFAIHSPKALARHLKSAGISRALTTSIDSILYSDPQVYDAKLFQTAASIPMLMPIATLNPLLSHWRRILARPALKAVVLIPNYHNYSLKHPSVAELMETLAAQRLPLILRLRVEDERNQYPLMKIPGVDWQVVVRFANRFHAVPILCLCAYRGEAVRLVQETSNVSVDLAFIEKLDTLPWLLQQIPFGRVLFGSHTPFLYTESAVMKLKAAHLAPKPYQAIACANARRLFNLSTNSIPGPVRQPDVQVRT